MIAAAVDEHARSQGATGLEAIPLDVESAEHVTPDELFGGTLAAFEAASVEQLARLGPERGPVVWHLGD